METFKGKGKRKCKTKKICKKIVTNKKMEIRRKRRKRRKGRKGRKRKIINFFNSNYPGVIRLIFSYIKTNKECVNFSRTCKLTSDVFDDMLNKSSTIKYMLKYLNNQDRQDHSVDLFGGRMSIKGEFYCSTIDEYETMPKKDSYFAKYFLIVLFIESISEMNKKYNKRIFMVSGGFALRLLLRSKSWKDHDKFPRQHTTIMHLKHFHIQIDDNEDIDVFVLGKNEDKTTMVKELLIIFNNKIEREFKLPFVYKDHHISIRSLDGLVSIYTGKSNDFDFEYVHRNEFISKKYVHGSKKCTRFKNYKVIDIVIKKNAIYPNDIFCLFDLDCCKIGWFPGLKTVLVSNDFIRSLSSCTNYSRLRAKTLPDIFMKRIIKYYDRVGVYTELKIPHQLTYYHDTIKKCNKNFLKNRIVLISKIKNCDLSDDCKTHHIIKNKKFYGYYFCKNFPHSESEYEVLPFERYEDLDIGESSGFTCYAKFLGIKQFGLYGFYKYVKV